MKQFFLKLKDHFIETKKTIAPFKWYICFHLIFVSIFIIDYFNPPAKDDPILAYEYSRGAWNYINQEVYIESARMFLIILILIFLFALSNIKNHPKLAKMIFIYPLIWLLIRLIILLFK